ncbi:hypothetical protein D9M71_211040 [compost metagenome]
MWLADLVAVPVENIRYVGVGIFVGRVVQVGVAGSAAQHQLMLAPAQHEGARRVDVEGVLGLEAVQAVDEHEHALACHGVGAAAAGRTDGTVTVRILVAVGGLQAPVIGQLLLQHGGQVVVRLGQRTPARGRVEGAREVGLRTVVVEQRDVTEAHAFGVVVLVVQAQAQQGAIGQVDIQGAVQHGFFRFVPVDEGVGFLVGTDQAAADIAAFGQRARDVGFGAVHVPGTCFGGNIALEFLGRALAHQVDGGRRRTGAAHQARRPTHHFDVVVDRHVQQRAGELLRTIGHLRRNAVVHEVLDLETTRVKGVAITVTVVAGDPRGHHQHVVDGGEVLIVHQLAGDHAHRLWRFP